MTQGTLVSKSGLPELERLFLNAMFKTSSLVVSDRAALRMFRNEARLVLGIADDVDLDLASRQVTVPRLQGIEDSSRNWSVLMVLEHLCLVNREIMSIIESLKLDLKPLTEVVIADFKPDPYVDDSVFDRFNSVTQEYAHMVLSLIPLKTRLHHRHPWFGPLDGHQWHCLAAAHQRIHRRQARKIIAMAGVV